ncbi:MAG TPA: hypothetical protein VMX17_00095 [Candidatus Glassbacteria bacterium]|nr:hypothetical protein [Candidatus Glassbacteria bacterium]
MNYENDLKIDESSLDLEWLEQASLFMRYAKYSAEARKNLDEVKQDFDIIKAKIDKNIREFPDSYGVTKVTEGAIQSTLLTDKEYTKAYQKVLDAKFEADMASSAVQAFNQRKEALENLVKLHGQSYFAGPKIARDLSEQRKIKENKVDSKIASKLSRQK